jgi:hypothetical protein
MKQKTVRELRQSLEGLVSEAFYDIDPQESTAGTQDAVSLWSDVPEGLINRSAADTPGARDQTSELETEISLEEVFEFGADIDSELAKAMLGGTRSESIRQSVLVKGVDALAFYVTLHAKGAQWGIYIPISSILYLGHIFASTVTADWNTCLKLAFRCLHQHELFHFATDYFAVQLELLTGEPCSKPARCLRDPKFGYVVLEEKLANTQMLRALARPPAPLRARNRMGALRKFVALQPAGYSDALQVKSRDQFDALSDDLAQNYIKCIDSDPRGIDAINYMALYPRWPTIDWRYCPVHVVHDEKRLDLPILDIIRFVNIPALYETDRFRQQVLGLPAPLQKSWQKAKLQLKETTALGGLNFKLWERTGDGDVYSIRLSKAYRAHLRYNRAEQRWYAEKVGDHQRMGHD